MPELLWVGLPGLVELEGDLCVHAEAEVVVHHVQRRLSRNKYFSKSIGNREKKTDIHCKENPIYVFLFWELRGLSRNFHIHVSVSDLYIPRIGPHISLQQNKKTDP